MSYSTILPDPFPLYSGNILYPHHYLLSEMYHESHLLSSYLLSLNKTKTRNRFRHLGEENRMQTKHQHHYEKEY